MYKLYNNFLLLYLTANSGLYRVVFFISFIVDKKMNEFSINIHTQVCQSTKVAAGYI